MDNAYVYGKLEDGELKYFVPVNGGITVRVYKRGRWSTVFYPNPTEAVMNEAGWYRIVFIEENGEDYQAGNVIYHYTGTTEGYSEIGDAEYEESNE